MLVACFSGTYIDDLDAPIPEFLPNRLVSYSELAKMVPNHLWPYFHGDEFFGYAPEFCTHHFRQNYWVAS